jgi:hypothetical protein
MTGPVPSPRRWAVVQHVGAGITGIGLDQLEDPDPGVPEHFQRLAADRQEDAHAGVAERTPPPDPRPVGGQVEAAAGEVHRQAHCLVGGIEHREADEHEHDRVADLDPQLRHDDAHRADTQGHREERQGPPGVGALLLVAGRLRQHQVGVPVPSPGPRGGGGHPGPTRTQMRNELARPAAW